MAKKTKSKSTATPRKEESVVREETPTSASTNGKKLGFRFAQGALMRAPFLLFGCLVLYLLKQSGYISPDVDSSTTSEGTGMGFSFTQILVVNIVSEACVKVWRMFLRENETTKKNV
ncbi:hypothetical protein CKM354_000141200 [Cercospora kikuchii]|uniref:Uncharacterized protein n=1 Tax=Cercospora kikuchii TaxID=84275 RepID=A0A9P3CCQ6_9PEZI|nr:uncharacterized protein CKM354_000141200 [Cercospora kikuchii]GIZ37985.1 hypothetical protein CKM354_000141200 [Cercospora kikuchii]